MLSVVYTCSFADIIIICVDFNTRIGCKLDFIPDIDNVTERLVLDHSKNSHGRFFTEFLKDGKMCVLNGCFEKEKDHYTFISPRGKSVVDYFVVPHECLQYCREFSVKTVSDFVSEYKLQEVVSDNCKLMDHSILSAKIDMSYIPHSELHHVGNATY